MDNRLNKPRVFLSYSKKDSDFVERLCSDLRSCQIDPWLDTKNIRHGKQWLEAIFRDGIANCDCILVYLTKNSIASRMVMKEMDAGLIQQFKNKGVAFLPYVESDKLRGELRFDLQTLQIPVLNPENYSSLLPRIVAEIWRSFLERTIQEAVDRKTMAGLERIFPREINHNWFEDIEDANNVTIAKLKINFTDNPSYFRLLSRILAEGGSVTLIMADPRAPAMWLRYMEEPSGVATGNHKNETTWIQGLEELAMILDRFDTWRNNLIKQGIDVGRLSIGVFPHYPTHAYYKFDKKLYVLHYPHRKRGFHGPLFLFNDPDTEVYKFLDDSLQKVLQASLPLEQEIADILQRYRDGMLSDRNVSLHRIDIMPREK